MLRTSVKALSFATKWFWRNAETLKPCATSAEESSGSIKLRHKTLQGWLKFCFPVFSVQVTIGTLTRGLFVSLELQKWTKIEHMHKADCLYEFELIIHLPCSRCVKKSKNKTKKCTVSNSFEMLQSQSVGLTKIVFWIHPCCDWNRFGNVRHLSADRILYWHVVLAEEFNIVAEISISSAITPRSLGIN